jgi:Dienelactone hydrolase family
MERVPLQDIALKTMRRLQSERIALLAALKDMTTAVETLVAPMPGSALSWRISMARAVIAKAAFDYLADRPDVDSKHIGSLGWSMGGGLAVQLAIHEPRFAACVVNYDPLPTNTADIQKIDASVLGIFGSLDRGIPSDKIRAFEECMKAAGTTSGGRRRLDSYARVFQASEAIKIRCSISFLVPAK